MNSSSQPFGRSDPTLPQDASSRKGFPDAIRHGPPRRSRLRLFFAALAWPGAAAADRVYHTQRLALAPVAGAPLQSGFVVNAHANERYVLNGAAPDATYQVTLLLFPGDLACAGAGIPVPTAQLATNVSGNGEARATFVPADVPQDLVGATIGGLWQVSLDGAVAYATASTAITLD